MNIQKWHKSRIIKLSLQISNIYRSLTMKCFKSRYLPVLVISLAAFIAGCQKEPEMTRDELVSYMAGKVSSDNLESSVRWLENMGTRFALAENRRDVAVKIRNRFISLGYDGASLDSFYLEKTIQDVTYTTWQYNVIATVEGTEDDSISIAGAHYDSYATSVNPFTTAPGANDNASGMAAVFEIARIVRGSRLRPKHTITFVAFAAEELGLQGSRYQAEKSAANGDKIIMMINHDMISYIANPSLEPWHLNIIHYANSGDLRDAAALLCDTHSTLLSYSDTTFNQRSDSYPYNLNGYKALFFHQGDIESTYHTQGDKTSVCNFEYAREVVKASCALLVDKSY